MGRGEPPPAGVLDHLKQALAHRGPDGAASRTVGNLGLVHTRLAIIDLATGDQPLADKAGNVLIANGEIYNYVEMRREIGEKRFRTHSDCEVPLLLMADDATDFTRPLRGMYAIASATPGARIAFLARDPFGIKPLYVHEGTRGLAFASEPRAFFEAGLLKPVLSPRARDELLQLQFTTGAETIFEGVRRVLPGERLTLEGGRIIARDRIIALSDLGPEQWSEEEALARLDSALMESVEMHQRADVPYGMFLSGGVDSSVVLACMRALNERPVEAFTVGFAGTGVADERAHAERVAKAAGANFHAVEFTEGDFWRLAPRVADALDDPTADYAVLPTYMLGAFVREHGLKVVLSGEGGDELFAGYGRYRRALRPRWLGGRAMRSKGALDGARVLRSPLKGWRDGIARAETEAHSGRRTALQAAQAADCADWLPHDLLLKLDRCLMAHGVEGRTPLLDPAVSAVAMALPDKLKIRGGQGKYLLRRWLDAHLPEAEPFTPKRGFTVPIADWIGRRGREIGALVAKQESIREICVPERVIELFERRPGQAAWHLLFYALWHKRHIERAPLEGDAFDSLA